MTATHEELLRAMIQDGRRVVKDIPQLAQHRESALMNVFRVLEADLDRRIRKFGSLADTAILRECMGIQRALDDFQLDATISVLEGSDPDSPALYRVAFPNSGKARMAIEGDASHIVALVRSLDSAKITQHFPEHTDAE